MPEDPLILEPTPEATHSDAWFFEVLPNRPLPHPDECLSGYLLRLAEGNGLTSLWDFANDLFPRWQAPVQLSRLRWEYPPGTWGRIPVRTQLSLADLRRLTVAPWVEKFRPPLDLREGTTLGPGHFLRAVVKADLQLCPLCLQREPYWRLLWRLSLVQVCLEHRCLLQTHCLHCGELLRVMSPAQQLVRCTVCGTDVRQLPAVAATPDLLSAQARLQANLHYLLDPRQTLVRPRRTPPETEALDVPKAIGLKFRYLRYQTAQSIVEVGRQLGVSAGLITALELGQPTPLPLYLSYLDRLARPWAEFAALEVPEDFLRDLRARPYLSLRICPTPDCPNHTGPPSGRVQLLADLHAQGIVRFHCTVCGRHFTRRLDGQLSTKVRKPAPRSDKPPSFLHSAAEIAILKELGLQGVTNLQIAQQLGWGEKTIRVYWQALQLEEQVHRAQAERRAQELAQCRAELRGRVEVILQELIQHDEEITLRRVGATFGHNPDYLRSCPEVAAYIQQVAQQHNPQVRQRRSAKLWREILEAIEALKQGENGLTIRAVEQRIGMPLGGLQRRDPELYAKVSQMVREHRERVKADQVQRICERINNVAARLIAQGDRPTFIALIRAVGLNKYQIQSNRTIRAALEQWVGDFASRD